MGGWGKGAQTLFPPSHWGRCPLRPPDAYNMSKLLCDKYYMCSPDLEIQEVNGEAGGCGGLGWAGGTMVTAAPPAAASPQQPIRIVYVPSHLYHMLFELFKVPPAAGGRRGGGSWGLPSPAPPVPTERHASHRGEPREQPPPAARARHGGPGPGGLGHQGAWGHGPGRGPRAAGGVREWGRHPRRLLQMSDRGLGVPLRKIDRLFSYMYSTAPTPPLGDGGAPLVRAPGGAAGLCGALGTSPQLGVAGGRLGVAGAAGGGLSLTWGLLGTFRGAHGWHGDTWGVPWEHGGDTVTFVGARGRLGVTW